jgi:hypothetical protein
MVVKIGWAVAFAATFVVEAPLYLLGLRGVFVLRRGLLVALLLNAATHPLAWWLTLGGGSWWRFASVEAGVWLTEGWLLWALTRAWSRQCALPLKDALGVSLVANALSAGIGLLLQ